MKRHKKELKALTASIRFTPTLLLLIDDEAQHRGISRADVVREHMNERYRPGHKSRVPAGV